MKMQKQAKGTFGYPPYQTKLVILRTVLYFLLAMAVFLLGYFSTGTKENLLTVVAVCGLLPACKSLVSVIMYLRIPAFSAETYRAISSKTGDMTVLYSLYLTSYKKNFPINCFGVRGNCLVGYTEFADCDVAACEEHIKELLKQNRLKNVTVKIFRDQRKFEERLAQLGDAEHGAREADIAALLCDISL
ncbi:MAG: hypothetical protein NC337_10495 [Roseburia sp.]|nr:hypothetical protein [Roseburia sp.]